MKPAFKTLIIFWVIFQGITVFAKDYSKFNLNKYQQTEAWDNIGLIPKKNGEIKNNFKQMKRKLNFLTRTEDKEKQELYFLELEELVFKNYNLIPDQLQDKPQLLNHYRIGMQKLMDMIRKTIQLYRNGNYTTTEMVIEKIKALQKKYHKDLSITD